MFAVNVDLNGPCDDTPGSPILLFSEQHFDKVALGPFGDGRQP